MNPEISGQDQESKLKDLDSLDRDYREGRYRAGSKIFLKIPTPV